MALNRSFDVSQGNFMCSVGPMGVQWVGGDARRCVTMCEITI